MAARQVGSVFIRVRPDADGFRRETDAKVRRELSGYNAAVPVSPDLDHSELRRERDSAQRYLDRNELELEIDMDFERRLSGMEESFRIMSESVTNTQRAVTNLKDSMRDIGQARVGVDREEFDDLIRTVRNIESEMELSTADARRAFEEFKQEAESESIDIDLEASPDRSSVMSAVGQMAAVAPNVPIGTRLNMASVARTMAALHMLGNRPINVDVNPRLPLRSILRMEQRLLAMSQRRVSRALARSFDRGWRTWAVGGARSLAGLGDMDELIHAVDSIVSRLDVLGTQWATVGTAAGSAVNVATHALGGLVVTIADASRAVGLLAAAPTGILAAWTALHTHRSIWQDFGRALEGDQDALERIPENGQRAVEAIDDLSQAVNRSIQDGFWGTMNDEIERFTETVGPALERGMTRTAEIYGDTMSSMLDLAQAWAETGQLDAGFSNINRMFEGVGGGIVEMFDAFVTVGLRASRMMPRLGHEFRNLGIFINDYLQWASEMGLIEHWIESGINVMSQMGRAGTGLYRTMQGLIQAFRNAGVIGLPAFVSGLEQAGDFMQSAQAQYRLGNMFSGMVDGARLTWEGVERVSTALYESHEWARQLSVVIGEVARSGLFRFGELLENTTFQGGILDLFDGVRDALDFLVVGTQSLGDILGGLGTISGQIIREMAPGIETFLGIFGDLANALTPLIVDAVVPLTDFIDNLGHAIRHNVNNLAIPALQGLLSMFLALPAPLQNALALWAALARFMPAISNGWGRVFNGINNAMRNTGRYVSALPASQIRDMARAQSAMSFAMQRSVAPMAAAVRQYERTGQIISGMYRPMTRLQASSAAMSSSMRGVGNSFRDTRTAIDDSMRRMTPFTTAWGGLRTASSAATTGMVRGLQSVDRTLGRIAPRITTRMERLLGSQASTAAAMSRGPSFTGIPRGLDFTAPIRQNIAAMDRMQQVGVRAMNAVESGATRMNAVVAGGAARISSAYNGVWGAIDRGSANAWAGVQRNAIAASSATATAFRNVPRQIGDAFRQVPAAVGGAMRGVVSTVGATFATLPALARTAAVGMSTALGTVTGAARGVASAVGGIFRGMFSLIGGLPGLLLIGGLTAIGQIRARSAEARREVDQLVQALEAGGESGLRKAVVGIEGMQDALMGLRDIGINTEPIIDDIIGGGDLSGIIGDLDEVARQVAQFESVTKFPNNIMDPSEAARAKDWLEEHGDQVNGLGITWNEAIDLGSGYFGRIRNELQGIQPQVEETRDRFDMLRESEGLPPMDTTAAALGFKHLNNELKDLGEGYAEASEEGQRFADSLAVALDTSNTVENRVQGLSGAMRVLRGDYESFGEAAVETWNREQQVLGTLEEARQSQRDGLGQLRGEQDLLATSSDKMNQTRVLGIQAVTEAHEMAIAASIEAYDAEMQRSGDVEKATDAASAAYEKQTGRLVELAKEAGFTGKDLEVLETAMSELADVDDLEFALSMSGLDTDDIAMIKTALDELEWELDDFDRKEWEAFLTANPDQAYGIVQGATDMVQANYAAREFVAELGVNPEVVFRAVADALGMLEAYESGNYGAILTAALEDDEVTEKFPFLLELADEWEGYREASLGANGMDELQQALNNLNETLQQIGEQEYGITFDSNAEETSGDIDEVGESISLLPGSIDLTIDSNAEETKGEVDEVSDTVDKLDGRTVRGTIDLTDEATPKAEGAITAIGTVDGSWALSRLLAEDEVTPKAGGARNALQLIPTIWNTLMTGSGNLEGKAGAARTAVESVPNLWGTALTASDGISGPAGSAKSAVESVPNRRDTTLSVVSQMIYIRLANAAKRAAESVPRTWSTMLLNPLARAHVASSNQARAAVQRIPRTWVTSIRAYSNVASVAGAARRALASIPRSRTVTVHTRRTSSTASADGNILNGGGVPVKAFANGGVENHVAQIAKPMTPYRVWAEPETGGEAYIPLAASKRSRSLAIWEETGRRLGAFADGGINGGQSNNGQGSGPTFNINNHYPQAEPTSRTVQRAAEMLGAGGGDW